jgi:acetoin utilization protein AcuB
MNIFDLMTKDVICVHEKDSFATAVEIMEKAGIHHLLVSGASGELVGILSDRDCKIAMRSPFSKGEPKEFANSIPISAIMTPMPQCLSPHASLGEAAQIMLTHHIHALPIVHDNVLIGIISSTDLLKVLAAQSF